VADLAGRRGWETRLRAAIAGLQPGQLQRLMAEMRLRDDLKGAEVPEELWAQFNAETRAAIEPILTQVFIESAVTAAAAYPTLTMDWALINVRAAEWAAKYSFNLVRLIDSTTRDGLQAAISNYFQTPESMGDLRAAIAKFIPTIQDKLGRTLYAGTRAEMIATTEVTRAATQGELAWVREIRADNPAIKMREVWQTNQDELVCPECGPRQGKVIEGHDFPPAHPRCRCWTNTELVGLR